MTQTQPTTGFCPYVPPLSGTADENAAWLADYNAAWLADYNAAWLADYNAALSQRWEEDRPARDACEEALRLNPVPPIETPGDSRTVEEVIRDMLGQEAWDAIAPGA